MKLICENSNSLHINANGVGGDSADTIGAVGHSPSLMYLAIMHRKYLALEL